MSVPEREAASSVSDLDVVVSADEHISEEVSDFFPYIDESTYGGIKRVIEQASEPWREVFSVTPPLPPFSNTPMASDYSGAGNVMAKAGDKLETKLMRLDEFDIDYAVLNPTLMVALPTVNNPQAAAALVDGYNEWVYETFVAESDRLSMAIVVPGQKPRMGAEEIEKWGTKDGVVAVQVGATGHRGALVGDDPDDVGAAWNAGLDAVHVERAATSGGTRSTRPPRRRGYP